MTDADDYTMGEMFNAMREERRQRRAKYGINCPGCNVKEPKRTPTILLPAQRCKVCGYRDPRKREEHP